MSVPREIAAGATLLFTVSFTGYPATSNTLAFQLNREGAFVAEVAGVANGGAFIVTAPAATTVTWAPGRYFWAAKLTDGATVAQAASGQLSVTPNFGATLTPTPSQVQLAALDASITAILARKSSSRSFNGQSSADRNLTELLDARDRLYARVCADLREAGLSTKGGARSIATQFSQ